jgi:hypothetical protein
MLAVSPRSLKCYTFKNVIAVTDSAFVPIDQIAISDSQIAVKMRNLLMY